MSKHSRPPFKVGDKVTTDFYTDEADVVRTVMSVRRYANCTSGFLVVADGGEPCVCCGHRPGTPTPGPNGIDSTWFKNAEEER